MLFEGKSKTNLPRGHLKCNTVNEGDSKKRVVYQYLHEKLYLCTCRQTVCHVIILAIIALHFLKITVVQCTLLKNQKSWCIQSIAIIGMYACSLAC